MGKPGGHLAAGLFFVSGVVAADGPAFANRRSVYFSPRFADIIMYRANGPLRGKAVAYSLYLKELSP
jgi:hypothetical protein